MYRVRWHQGGRSDYVRWGKPSDSITEIPLSLARTQRGLENAEVGELVKVGDITFLIEAV